MSDWYDMKEWTKLGPGRLVVVSKDTNPETTNGIRESIRRTADSIENNNVHHLLRQGWFVSMNDECVTIDIRGEKESFLLEQVVVCLGLETLEEWFNARRKKEKDESN